MAGHVAKALQVQLTERQQQELSSRSTNNPAAYDYYLRGKAVDAAAAGIAAQYVRAIGLFQRAVDTDSGFAAAHAELARSHLNLYWFRGDPSAKRVELAKAALDKALSLDPKLPVAHLALADYHYHGRLDYARALDAVKAAQRLAPNDADAIELEGWLERRQNRWDAAIADFKRASELDPRNFRILEDLCETQHLVRDYVGAQRSCAKLLSIDPGNPNGNVFLAILPVLQSGDVKRSLALFAQRQLGAESLAAELMSPDRRKVWPAYLDNGLAGYMATAWARVDGAHRIGYFSTALVLAIYQKKSPLARQFADSIIAYVPRHLRGNFFDSEMYVALSLAHAAKGDTTGALRDAKRAMDILPLRVDALRGASNLHGIALATVLTGAHDEAFAALQQLLKIPSSVSAASIKADPWYEPLRQDPRFLTLVSGR